MNGDVEVEKWLSKLFSELIKSGIDSDEHIRYRGSSLGNHRPPNLKSLKKAHAGWTGEFLTPLLQEHLEKIVRDYEKLEKP